MAGSWVHRRGEREQGVWVCRRRERKGGERDRYRARTIEREREREREKENKRMAERENSIDFESFFCGGQQKKSQVSFGKELCKDTTLLENVGKRQGVSAGADDVYIYICMYICIYICIYI